MAIPFARQVARLNQRFGNRLLGPITWYVPGFGRIEHRGRRTGRLHVAPMLGFRSADGRHVAFALTYGREAQWVQNALVAGEIWYETRQGSRVHLVEPRVVHDPARRAVPWPVRIPLALIRVDEFLVATIERDQAGAATC